MSGHARREPMRVDVTNSITGFEIPVLAIAGEKGIGANYEALVRAFASNLKWNIIIPVAGHFLAEERPTEITAAPKTFLAD